MCSTNYTHCLGIALLHMALLSILLNILLFFPGMQRVSPDKIPDEAWKLGGFLGSGIVMLFPAVVYLQLRKFDCWGCFHHPAFGRSLSNVNAVLFSSIGILGSSYGLFISLLALYRGPKCFVGGDKWEYPFHKGNYLVDLKFWKDCKSPPHIVPWHLSIFIIQGLLSTTQLIICICELISGLLGTVFVSEKFPWAHRGIEVLDSLKHSTVLAKDLRMLLFIIFGKILIRMLHEKDERRDSLAAFSSMQQPLWM